MLKSLRQLLPLALICLSITAGRAQRNCGTMPHEQQLIQQDSKYLLHKQAIENYVQSYINSGAYHHGSRSVITIPVVVHVMYNSADLTQNISQAQIQAQINRLNLDYHKLNADTGLVPSVWKSLVADCNIQFCLAQRDPNGNSTTGITRTATSTSSFGTDDAIKYTAQGGHDAWPATSYLNLWCCKLTGTLLGYAQFPGGAAATDGVVITYKAFGTGGTATAPYDLGRTATHEVGHWLNLYHIWGDDAGACTGSDLVNDTPNQADANSGTPSFPLTDACTATSPGVMFMDYMDYTDDATTKMFTIGQNARIQANFASGGARVSLLNSLGCVPPSGGPATAFTASKTAVCVGQSINFTDLSTGSPTSWAWTINGGTPASSTAQNPQNVLFNTPGTYSITLTATNAGGSTPLTKVNYIVVSGTTALPVKEGFEGTTFPPNGWSLSNPDGQTAWVRTTSASGFGLSVASAYFDNYSTNYRGQRDYLYSPIYNFTTGINSNSKLKFDYAYSYYNSTSLDSLQVIYSTNCGSTWSNLWVRGGTALATTSTVASGSFVPLATEWKRDSSISLATLAGQSSVQFAFVNISQYGNNILLDNINIDTPVTVTCVKPTASMVVSATSITVGSSITYTNQSTNSPTSALWTFAGGSPSSSSSLASATVSYASAGTFTSKLKVTNGCGVDSITRTITVAPAGISSGCDTLSNSVALDSARLYFQPGSWGYVAGSNGFLDSAKAEKFNNVNGAPITGGLFAFAIAKFVSSSDSINIILWNNNGTAGKPGSILAKKKVAYSTIAANISSIPYKYTYVAFNTPVATGATFYLGFQIDYRAGDTIGLYTTNTFNGASHQLQGWEQFSNGLWQSYDSSYNVGLSNYIFPIQCSSKPTAKFGANDTVICVNDTASFSDQSLNNPTSWYWSVIGPLNQVSSAQNPKFIFNTAGNYTVTLIASNGSGRDTATRVSYIIVKTPPTATITPVAVSCYGGSTGSATVTPTGTGTPFTYLWNTGTTLTNITNRPSGNYTVTVKDAFGCSTTASTSISQPFSALTAIGSTSAAICGGSNGTASVTASGGNGGFSYLWSNTNTTNSISNVAAGIYTVTVKDNKNCQVIVKDTVKSQTYTVTINFNTVNPSCGINNGAIATNITGSTNGVRYHWNTGDSVGSLTNLAAGTYAVTVTTSQGCTGSNSVSLTNTSGPSLSLASTPVACYGGSNGLATVTATGGSGTYTYAWSGGGVTNNISGKPTGNYSVTVNDGNCSSTASVTISQPAAALTLSISNSPATCAASGSATVLATGGNGGYTYLWNTGAIINNITSISGGNYSVTVKDSKQCSANTTTTVANQKVTLTKNSTQSICAGQRYLGYTQSGTYLDTIRTAGACDTVRTLNLSVRPIAASTINQTICAGQSYLGYGSSGTYRDTFANAAVNGCDSIRTIALTVNPRPIINLSVSICSGQSYLGHTSAGTYVDTVRASGAACDTIRTLTLTIANNLSYTINQSICQGLSYLGHSQSGTYRDTLRNASGCDTIRTLILTVKPKSTSTVNKSICQGQAYNGHTQSGSYVDVIPNGGVNGCDSLISLTLIVNQKPYRTINQTICSGQRYLGHTSSGTYIDTFSGAAANGCDSIRTLILTVTQRPVINLSASICSGSYLGHSTAGTYVDTLRAGGAGCDTIRTLTLQVSNLVTYNLNQTICAGQSYLGHTTAGSYVDTLRSATSCDTIRTLKLKVKASSTANISKAICIGDSYLGHSLAGVYKDTLRNAASNGCDSIRILSLSVNSLPNVSWTQTDTLYCTNRSNQKIKLHLVSPIGGVFAGSGVSNDTLYCSIGSYTTTYTFTDSNQCRSTISKGFKGVICEGVNDVNGESIKFYPNPNNGNFIIESSMLGEQITIYDVLSRVVGSHFITSLKEAIHIDFLSSGVYTIQVGKTAKPLQMMIER